MIPLVAALVAAALPVGAARYRVEIGGADAGVATLGVRCDGPRCTAAWEATLALPEAAGGGARTRRIEVQVDREGRLAGTAAVTVDGAPRPAAAVPGAVPATVLEVVLTRAALAAGGGSSCAEAFDEESGATGRACARRDGDGVRAALLGAEAWIQPGPDGFPAEVRLPAQRTRYVRDPRAAVPAQPPRLEVAVAGPGPEAARAFCGIPRDPPFRGPVPDALPPPAAEGRSCREKAAAYADRARAAGLEARLVVGVAFDGAGFAWHAWNEVRAGARWIPVDATFGELPARGPRFTVARFAPDDAGARAAAGRRILACWGRAGVE